MNTYYLVNVYYEYNIFNFYNLSNNILSGSILLPLTQIQANTLDYMIKMNRIERFTKLNILGYNIINQETYNINYEMLNDKYYKINNNTIQQYNIITSIGNILQQK